MTTVEDRRDADRPLNSWKEIAAFFGKDERTVKRWETARGLPVHRLPGHTRATVFAYPSELQAWLTGHRDADIAAPAAPVDEAGEAPTDEAGESPIEVDGESTYPPARRWRGIAAAAAIAFLCGAAALLSEFEPVQPILALFETPAPPNRPVQPAAQTLYLEGLYHLNTRSETGLRRAARNFTQAVAEDPGYAEAYAGLAKAHILLGVYRLMPAPDAYPLAKTFAERALALDPDLAEGYASLGFTEFYWTRDFERSKQLFEQALELEERSAETHHWFAMTRMYFGDFDLPVREITRAQELDPESRAILANKALILYRAGRLAEAEAILAHMQENAPDYVVPHFYLADIYFDQKRYLESIDEALAAARMRKDDTMFATQTQARQAYRDGGEAALLSTLFAAYKADYARGAASAYKLARIAALKGDTASAYHYLDVSAARREQDTLDICIDAAFRQLHDEPRFGALMAAVGFPAHRH